MTNIPDYIKQQIVDDQMQTMAGRKRLSASMYESEVYEFNDIYLCKHCRIVHRKDEEHPCELEMIRQVDEG